MTRLLDAAAAGDRRAADELLSLVYDELRALAAARLAAEAPGQTLQATALVHEAYLRLIGSEDARWESRGHFFAAAAQAMRRILVESARSRRRLKRGGRRFRIELLPTAFVLLSYRGRRLRAESYSLTARDGRDQSSDCRLA